MVPKYVVGRLDAVSQPYEPLPSHLPVGSATGPGGPIDPTKNGRCLLYGCIGVFVGGLLLILCAGFATYFTVRKQVEKYTSTQPLDLPTVQYSDEKLAELESRLESFQAVVTAGEDPESDTVPPTQIVEENDSNPDASELASSDLTSPDQDQDQVVEDTQESNLPVRELVLSADDINALIAREEKLRGA